MHGNYKFKTVKHLSAHATISPSDLYETVTNKFNGLTDKYNHLRRKSKGGGEEEDTVDE